MRETLGASATYVDPRDVDAIAAALAGFTPGAPRPSRAGLPAWRTPPPAAVSRRAARGPQLA